MQDNHRLDGAMEFEAGVVHKAGRWRPVALLTALAAVILLSWLLGWGEKLQHLHGWLAGLGAWAPLVFLLIYIGCVVAAIPGVVITVIAGALFGWKLGLILASIGSTVGASLAFLISRSFAREAVVHWLGPRKKFQKLELLTAMYGATIVALTRLVPLFPFNLLNYGFGLTRVRFGTYVFWSWLCMLPETALVVMGADAVTKGLESRQIPYGHIIGIALVAASLVVLVRKARRRLRVREMALTAQASSGAPVHLPSVEPLDNFNQTLVENVHPPQWVNPEPEARYNLVVIGAGTAGLVTAAGAASLGARVALVERHLFGGDCLNYGCVPSKAIIRSSRAAAAVQEAAGYGVLVPEGVEVDFPQVMARMRRLRAQISRNDSVRRFQDLGVDVFLGQAGFLSPDQVQVAGKVLKFKKAVIATGGRPVQPVLEGLAEAGFLTNETVFSLTGRPKRLAVLGAGPLGCEIAQAFSRLGCQVSLLHKHPRIMNREDADAASLIEQVLAREGVGLLLNCRPVRVRQGPGGKIIDFERQGQPGELEVDEILVGAGRAPNVEGLNLEAAGVRYEAGRGRGVLVNDYLQTSNLDIYAAGDICSPYQFTHLADAQARIVIRNALFFGRQRMSSLTIPWCTYTDPEVAHVGLGEEEAKKGRIEYSVFRRDLQEVDRAVVDGDEEGFVKVLVKKGTGRILGATVVARHAGEMVSEITAAMKAGLGLAGLAEVIHPYPTQAEAIRQTGGLYQRTRLTPGRQRLLRTFFQWRRRTGP